ncbi:cuticle protein 7-like isoform X3 [Homalodisca vitripennis]|uniref:cuticle protein 7-like isoform X3 n=1 Tax=Homalodisca vitripennis TaxID=197043 RepID=UPI001EEBB87D|nr:cuticle protein 7-like isoform X3 [Homalodisca vitripennis]
MKVLVVLCAVAACVVAKPFAGYAYSAAAPLTSPYAYAAPYYAAPHLAYAAPAPIAPAVVAAPVAAPVGIKTQYYAQDFTGLVSYGHSEPFQAQSVVQDAAGNKVGSFSYVNPEGKVIQTNYIADHEGYRVASNDLPVAPEVPAVAPAALPEPVQDTPEVAEAKAKFFNEFEQVKSRARRSAQVQTPASTSPLAAPTVVATPVARVAAPFAPLAPVVSAYSTPVVAPYSAPLAYPYNYPYYPSVVYSK